MLQSKAGGCAKPPKLGNQVYKMLLRNTPTSQLPPPERCLQHPLPIRDVACASAQVLLCNQAGALGRRTMTNPSHT